LLVTDGETERTYGVADLEKLPVSEASFRGVTYRGVQLAILLEDAGFEAGALVEVKAVALDGYSFACVTDTFFIEGHIGCIRSGGWTAGWR
jgi:hypothetical protein